MVFARLTGNLADRQGRRLADADFSSDNDDAVDEGGGVRDGNGCDPNTHKCRPDIPSVPLRYCQTGVCETSLGKPSTAAPTRNNQLPALPGIVVVLSIALVPLALQVACL
jgi:hypothetical protein